ncbi:MAG TPA: phosphoribosylformylglycinamidine cyclo-ligase [Planctomycetaceae bacterium]|nr:phosphoribosylformylglycinamidine cyclo-ligase [Planctomycetaceae bacterium]HIQ21430.1 phosphoribosylformylglycinamidine cyclo-ligase [Planctomycetota bacterium]
MGKLTYQSAGVDLELYRQAMARLPRLVARTHTPRVIQLEQGFAGLFQLDFDSPLFARRYRHPLLVAAADGVGTKLKVAAMAGVHNTVGIDLVAMSVNDALCCGAEPLFFLDYVAMPRDDPPLLEQIVEGIAAGCIQSGCALLGGETAILPDVYQPGDYDLAGFCVGVVERRNLIDGSTIATGDAVLGVASSGLHSNGFSLVRKVVFEVAGLDVDHHIDQLDRTVGQVLLEPTRIYARPVRQVLQYYRVKRVVHGMAHITGGGLRENLARILPPRCRAVIDRSSWPVPPVFGWIQQLGRIEEQEMERVFNMGIGLVLVVSSYHAESIRRQLADSDLASWIIGRIEEGPGEVQWA